MEETSHIEAIDSLRVLANDERLRLLKLLMRGPATLTQLGAVVEHHPAWVRHHLLSLQQAGLVELVEMRIGEGLGGRALATLWGQTHDVEAAIALASEAIGRGNAQGASTATIPNADAEVIESVRAGTRFFKEWRG